MLPFKLPLVRAVPPVFPSPWLVNVHLAGKDIHVESEEADMYAAIDTLMDKLDRQVLKFKEKQTEHRVSAQQISAEL